MVAAMLVAMTAEVMAGAVMVMMVAMMPAVRLRMVMAMARRVVRRLAVILGRRITVAHRRRLRIVDAGAMVTVMDDNGAADDSLGLRHAGAEQAAQQQRCKQYLLHDPSPRVWAAPMP